MRMARKAKNARSKRAMMAREAKVVEEERSSLFMRGTSTNELINEILKDLNALKQPNSTFFRRRNDKRPFEDETSVEFLCMKNEASIFGFGTHSKKRPNNLILGRMFDYKIYDMYEFGLTEVKPACLFSANSAPSYQNKPLIVFQGDAFETDTKLEGLKNFFLDMFAHKAMDKINLGGLEHVIVLTAEGSKVAFRHYSISFKKSGGRVPRVELEELGPSFNMELRREREASADIKRAACRVPKQVKAQSKLKKNYERNALGETMGRIHMQKQSLDEFQTRKVKALKRGRDKVVEAERAKEEAKRAKRMDDSDEE
ncbi:hypothetical protein GUITHDRAFT_112900 [Guillardia theta CCMP2712]|uniref:Ribosome production factor 2 homolog n=1 Tax=Guillardia theta (strain CCMP2712) TaxID=905079 RepID=L1IY40_GUITC|nr:hypothetical protein GUITHDRAFT_112900 [Guillardia theta CCMP2712]EKX41161.1 hypothetical protein GUITHDRAFT_112900 [Guillardia theta CCMP2712]|eukprot:XP_005828141.1 hypothetical protein GUITHDRAFT_112900 [Guillardia theta CCMP2712]